MENWDLGYKVRLGMEQNFAGNNWKHLNPSLLDAEPPISEIVDSQSYASGSW